MTRRTFCGLKENPKLNDLIRKAVDAYDALTPERQREHRAAQRKSWVVGEMMLSHPEMSREQAEQIYNRVS